MVGDKKKQLKQPKKQKKLRIDDDFEKLVEADRIKRGLDSWQEALIQAAKRELTYQNLVEHDRELLLLLSHIRTTEELLDLEYNIIIKDGWKSESNLVTIINAGVWLLENKIKGRCVYDALDLTDPVYCQKYGLPYINKTWRGARI